VPFDGGARRLADAQRPFRPGRDSLHRSGLSLIVKEITGGEAIEQDS